MSPEILKGEKYDAFKSDVFSLGVVFSLIVFGKLPFDNI